MVARLFMATVGCIVLAIVSVILAIGPDLPEWSRWVIAIGAVIIGIGAVDAARLKA